VWRLFKVRKVAVLVLPGDGMHGLDLSELRVFECELDADEGVYVFGLRKRIE
jgi:hypothetical protein